MAVSSEHLHNVNTHVQGLKSLEGNCVTVALLLQELYGWKIIDGFFRLDSPAILAGHTWNMTEKGDLLMVVLFSSLMNFFTRKIEFPLSR